MLSLVLNTLSWVLPYLFVVMTIITVHELGHFWAARSFGVAIERFSIGFGRSLASWRDKHGTEWRVAWIPFGGYVQFAGDENAASVPDKQVLDDLRQKIVATEGRAAVNNYLAFKPLWQRAVVAAAGPFANFILAIFVFAVLSMTIGEPVETAKVGQVLPGSAAAAAGFQPGDVVVRAAGSKIEGFDDISRIVSERAGVPMVITVQRGPALVDLNATPRPSVVKDMLGRSQTIGLIGLEAAQEPGKTVFRHYDPVSAVGRGAIRTWNIVSSTAYYLSRLVRGQVSVDQLGGPLRTVQLAHALADTNSVAQYPLQLQALYVVVNLLNGIAVISIGIGIFNLLPIPVLDGGHLLFYAYEAVARRPLAESVQAIGYRVGLALILGLMLFLTTNDLRHSSLFHFVGGLFS